MFHRQLLASVGCVTAWGETTANHRSGIGRGGCRQDRCASEWPRRRAGQNIKACKLRHCKHASMSRQPSAITVTYTFCHDPVNDAVGFGCSRHLTRTFSDVRAQGPADKPWDSTYSAIWASLRTTSAFILAACAITSCSRRTSISAFRSARSSSMRTSCSRRSACVSKSRSTVAIAVASMPCPTGMPDF